MSKPLCTIVGMGSGISLSVAKRFAKEGYKITMIGRREFYLEKLKNQLAEEGVEAYYFIADVSDFEKLKTTFDQIKKEQGDTEVLVYNVSVFREATPTQLDAETCVKDFRANVAAALVAVQQVVQEMKNKKRGTILITGGGQALEPYPAYSSLAIGKAGIRNLSYSLHGELKPFGIHVATITINGMVAPNTQFAPDLICEEFWRLHQQPESEFEREVIFE